MQIKIVLEATTLLAFLETCIGIVYKALGSSTGTFQICGVHFKDINFCLVGFLRDGIMI